MNTDSLYIYYTSCKTRVAIETLTLLRQKYVAGSISK